MASRLWALAVAVAAFGGIPVALMAVSRSAVGQRIAAHGHGSAVDVVTARPEPLVVLARRRPGHQRPTRRRVRARRVGLAWACLAVLAVVVVAELVYQARHGMPSPRRRSLLGLGRLGRWIAVGLLAIVPVAGARGVTATGRHGPTAPVVQPRMGPVVQRGADAPPAPSGPSTHVVRRGESVWSIAEQYAPRGEADEMAAEITRLNLGRVMSDGHRFVTAALIEPGWELLLPESVHPAGAPPAPVEPVTPAPPAPARAGTSGHRGGELLVHRRGSPRHPGRPRGQREGNPGPTSPR
ncbi:MAG: LysM domain-containing protein [Ilumatobacteraceae bacterium]